MLTLRILAVFDEVLRARARALSLVHRGVEEGGTI